MLKNLPILLAAALTVFSITAGFLSTRQAPPALVASPATTIDLGTLRQGTETKAHFVLRNQSRYAIDIARVVTSCGCSAGAPDKPVLRPGESTSLETTLLTGTARRALTVRVIVVYRIRTRQRPEMARLDLALRALVDPDFLYPTVLAFRRYFQETRSATIAANRLAQLHISEVYCTHKAFHATFTRLTDTPRSAYRVDVTFVPHDWTRASGSAELVLRTNSLAEPTGRIVLTVTHSPRD